MKSKPSRPAAARLISLDFRTTVLSKSVQQFVRVHAPKVVFTHVRVIDGRGAPMVEDQNIVIEGGKISALQKGTWRCQHCA